MHAQTAVLSEQANALNVNIDFESMDAAHSLFTNKMKMLAHYCATNNAFVYLVASEQCTLYGEEKIAENQDFHLLSTLIPNPKHPIHWLSEAYNDEANKLGLAMLVLVSTNAKGDVTGMLGTYIDNSRKKSTLGNQASMQMLTCIAQSFADELKLQQSVYTLKQKQTNYSQMAELNQDFICVKDQNHRIVYANKSLLATFSNSKHKSIVGLSSTDLYEPEASAKIIESDLQAFSSGFYKSNQFIRLANQQDRILDTTKKIFTGIDGKTYLLAVSRDVTQKEILINDLKRSNDDLDNFAYVASHDLRSPLNVIKRLTTWVKEDCTDILPLDSKENIDLVLNRVERMEKLLVDLLSYSRIGKEYQEATVLNLREMVVELLSLIDLPMGFVVNCDNVDISVPAVPFNVVMRNLLANAIKHHDSGNAKIEIKAKSNASGSVISILDNGPGIQKKDRDRIFQLFETLRPRDEVEGSGMGLSVVKKIVEHYGGNITVEDNQPRGTKFVINWPLNNIARSVLDNLND